MLNVCISKMLSCAYHHRALQREIYRTLLYVYICMYGFVCIYELLVHCMSVSLIIFVLTSHDKSLWHLLAPPTVKSHWSKKIAKHQISVDSVCCVTP